jgi:cation transport regulator ChaB
MPIESKSDLPGTIERSPAKAQRTFRKAYNSALETFYQRAKELDIQGRSKMDKQELAQKIAQQQD